MSEAGGISVESVVHRGWRGQKVADPQLVRVQVDTGISGLRTVTLSMKQVDELARQMSAAVVSSSLGHEVTPSDLQTALQGVARTLDEKSDLHTRIEAAKTQIGVLKGKLEQLLAQVGREGSLAKRVEELIDSISSAQGELARTEKEFFSRSQSDASAPVEGSPEPSAASGPSTPAASLDVATRIRLTQGVSEALSRFHSLMEEVRKPGMEYKAVTKDLEALEKEAETLSREPYSKKLTELEGRVANLSIGHLRIQLSLLVQEIKVKRAAMVQRARADWDKAMHSTVPDFAKWDLVLVNAEPGSDEYKQAKSSMLTKLQDLTRRIIAHETAHPPRSSFADRKTLSEIQKNTSCVVWVTDCLSIIDQHVALIRARAVLSALDHTIDMYPHRREIYSDEEIARTVRTFFAQIPKKRTLVDVSSDDDLHDVRDELEAAKKLVLGPSSGSAVTIDLVESKLKILEARLKTERDQLVMDELKGKEGKEGKEKGGLDLHIREGLGSPTTITGLDADHVAGALTLLSKLGTHRLSEPLQKAIGDYLEGLTTGSAGLSSLPPESLGSVLSSSKDFQKYAGPLRALHVMRGLEDAKTPVFLGQPYVSLLTSLSEPLKTRFVDAHKAALKVRFEQLAAESERVKILLVAPVSKENIEEVKKQLGEMRDVFHTMNLNLSAVESSDLRTSLISEIGDFRAKAQALGEFATGVLGKVHVYESAHKRPLSNFGSFTVVRAPLTPRSPSASPVVSGGTSSVVSPADSVGLSSPSPVVGTSAAPVESFDVALNRCLSLQLDSAKVTRASVTEAKSALLRQLSSHSGDSTFFANSMSAMSLMFSLDEAVAAAAVARHESGAVAAAPVAEQKTKEQATLAAKFPAKDWVVVGADTKKQLLLPSPDGKASVSILLDPPDADLTKETLDKLLLACKITPEGTPAEYWRLMYLLVGTKPPAKLSDLVTLGSPEVTLRTKEEDRKLLSEKLEARFPKKEWVIEDSAKKPCLLVPDSAPMLLEADATPQLLDLCGIAKDSPEYRRLTHWLERDPKTKLSELVTGETPPHSQTEDLVALKAKIPKDMVVDEAGKKSLVVVTAEGLVRRISLDVDLPSKDIPQLLRACGIPKDSVEDRRFTYWLSTPPAVKLATFVESKDAHTQKADIQALNEALKPRIFKKEGDDLHLEGKAKTHLVLHTKEVLSGEAVKTILEACDINPTGDTAALYLRLELWLMSPPGQTLAGVAGLLEGIPAKPVVVADESHSKSAPASSPEASAERPVRPATTDGVRRGKGESRVPQHMHSGRRLTLTRRWVRRQPTADETS